MSQRLKKNVKAVLFDLDGTLLDTEALSDKAMLEFYRTRGLLSEEMYQTIITRHDGRLPWELKKQILGLRGSEWAPIVIRYAQKHWNVPNNNNNISVQDLWTGWEGHLNDLCAEVQACPGATALVAALAQRHIPLAIATSSRRTAVMKKATNHGETLFRYFDDRRIVAGDDEAVRHGKPAPDIYWQAAQRLGVDPRDCLVVEDALSGVRAGKAAGCMVVAVPDPRFTAEEKAVFAAESDVVLESLWDFETLDLGFPLQLNRDG